MEVNLVVSPASSRTTSTVYFQTTGVDAYYQRVFDAGAHIAIPIADRHYGMRDFRLLDPSGNELSFGEPTGS